MNWVALAVRQPVTVAVGVILVLLAGIVAVGRLPIQLTPNVEDTVVTVTTRWEGASPQEIEQEIVDPQEDKLEGLASLVQMTSESQQGQAKIRLQFLVGTRKEDALREVSDKLRQVPDYPENTDEPVVEASDPDTRDYIAWVVFQTTDPDFDIRTLQDFAQDRIQPVLERVSGMAEVNVLGGREREAQIIFDPEKLAQRGIPLSEFIATLQRTNQNVSAGELADGKSDVRVRTISQFSDIRGTLDTVVRNTPGGPVRIGDVAEVIETYKEPRAFVRSRGVPVIAINADKELDANVIEVMAHFRDAIARLNAPGGVLESEARRLGLDGDLILTQVYDQTTYIDDALSLVRSNIWIGGTLAILVLLLFLRSIRSAGIIALAIPISVVGAIVSMVALGRSVNVISLAGMAFAIGMVVDNSIVVLENIHRHIEMGKKPHRAALDGAQEVWGAVLAATLTTIVVFIPILLIQEEAGQLFRDIALAICAAVGLSLIVSVTVIPTTAARWLRWRKKSDDDVLETRGSRETRGLAGFLGSMIEHLSKSYLWRIGVVATLTIASLLGTSWLMPPSDYLPTGNRNLVFGMMIPPSGYNLDQKLELGRRVEETIRPFFEAGMLEPGSAEAQEAEAALPRIRTKDRGEVVPPPLENYFLVAFEDIIFHGAISRDPKRIVDVGPLFFYASRPEVVPGTFGFAFQLPLFRLGGSTGSAVKIQLSGDDLDSVVASTGALFVELMGAFGVTAVKPSPANFMVPGPELQVRPRSLELQRMGMTPEDLGLAVQTNGDGRIIGEYRLPGGDTIDLKVLSTGAIGGTAVALLGDIPVATPSGHVVPLGVLADLERTAVPQQINRVARQRSVTLELTPGQGEPLDTAIAKIEEKIEALRASGAIPPTVEVHLSGSASKLAAVKRALLGDGTFMGILGSSLALALIVVYLLMCVLFQTFIEPLVILFSVPLATLGGFAGLAAVHQWSLVDPYLPVQKLDVLTMLGFVILIGVVVNNAILIVHQSLNFMGRNRSIGGGDGEYSVKPLPPQQAIAAAVRTRVRPIFMSTLTSIGGMLPLVLMPGSGSELYRGLGSVVIGGLLVSTVFTLILVPLLLSLSIDLRERLSGLLGAKRIPAAGGAALLLAALPLFSGCAVEPPARAADERFRSLVDEIVAREIDGAHLRESVPRTLAESAAPLDPALESRRGALAEIGGDPAYSELAVDLGLDLEGKATHRDTVGLSEAVRIAVECGLGVRLARLGPEIAAENRTEAEADFDLGFFSTAEFQRTDEPTRVAVIGTTVLGRPENVSEEGIVTVGVRKRLVSGATVTAETRWNRFQNETRGIGFQPDPAHGTSVALGVTQPLLRGQGSEVTTAPIALAENDQQRARQLLRLEVIALTSAVEEAYWALASAEQAVLVQERLLAQGEEVHHVLESRRAFDARPAEVADAVATVEERRATLVQFRRILRASSDQLKFLLNDPARPLGAESILRTEDELPEGSSSFEVSLRAAILGALSNRPEVEAAVLDIDDAELRERVARNLRLPALDLVAEVAILGLDDSFSGAYNDWTSESFVDGLIGLSFEVPLGNRAARAAERRAELERTSAELILRRVVENVVQDVKEALRDVRTQEELVDATRNLRIAQSENLRALIAEEETRAALTPEFLALKFLRQSRLASARLQEMEARSSVRRAIARYRRAIGTLPPVLGTEVIEIGAGEEASERKEEE